MSGKQFGSSAGQFDCKVITPFFRACRLTLKKPVHAEKHGTK
jgi:hypothetical protein